MNISKYILRSLLYYWRNHLALIAGIAIAVTVIVGALAVGGSVRKSLLDIVDQRLGNINYVMIAGKYFSRQKLADIIADKGGIKTAPLIALQGTAMSDGGAEKLPEINLVGIDKKFLSLFTTTAGSIPPGAAVINQTFAEDLGLKKGEVFIIRIPNPGILPDDIALTKEKDSTNALRLRIMKIAEDSFPGDFSLKSQQQKPRNVFVNIDWLANKIDRKDRCNIILAGVGKDISLLNNIVYEKWEIEDIGLQFRKIRDPAFRKDVSELRSERIFIDDYIAEQALAISDSEGVLTYFVNAIRNPANGKSCPYSFVSAVDSGIYTIQTDSENKKEEKPPIVINSWLAEDLQAKEGDKIELLYYFPGRMRQLVEKKKTFRIKRIVDIKGWASDRNLMPDFPGLADTENCSDWDPGIPIDLKKIRDKDEQYWDDYRGTPKAFISLEEGRKIWSNQFGSLTSARFRKSEGEAEFELIEKLDPGRFGLSFIDIASQARFAAKKSVDFGGLFLGLSFFIIFSAFILTAMLFALSIQSRAQEIKILSNLGFESYKIRRTLMLEHSVPALIGAFAGIPLGIIYNGIVIDLLNTLWTGAVGTSNLKAFVTASPAIIGSLSGFAIAMITIWFILKKHLKNLRNSQNLCSATVPGCTKRKLNLNYVFISGSILFLSGLSIVITFLLSKENIKPSGPFFAAGGLLLVSFWCLTKGIMNKYVKDDFSSSFAKGNSSFKAVLKLCVKNSTCNIIRSMAGIILLSCGIFLTISVSINMRSAKDLSKNSSGTGGYNLFVKTTLPVIHDLNTEKGLKAYNFENDLFKEVKFVQMRLSDGNEASCMNLNRVENPAILGVDFAKFAKRKAFTFKAIASGFSNDDPWNELNTKKADADGWNTTPVVADNNVIMWIMGKGVGDTIEVQNENSTTYNLLLAGGLSNSIFQGYVIMPITHFINMYPASSGSRVLLVDCPDIKEQQITDAIKNGMSGLGVEVETCRARLRRFQKVENTYLSIFLLLGGLGLIIGAAGFGIIVIRNIIERREELAIMHALGFNRKLIRKIVTFEHLILIIFGTLIGAIAAGISAIPAIISSRAPVPWNVVIIIIAGIVICGIICVYSAAVIAVKKKPIKALRKE